MSSTGKKTGLNPGWTKRQDLKKVACIGLRELMEFLNSHIQVHLLNTSFRRMMHAEKVAFDAYFTE